MTIRRTTVLLISIVGCILTPWLAQAQDKANVPPRPVTGAGMAIAASGSQLAQVKSWGYQLQHAKAQEIARSPFDLVVIDYSADGSDGSRFNKAQLQRMKTKPDGSRRYILSYLSIGEAEDYRFYWKEGWVERAPFKEAEETTQANPGPTTGAPAPIAPSIERETIRIPKVSAPNWLGRENTQWAGNYLVRYWEAGWQSVIFGTPQSYLERIIAAGFDGVYLDRVDAYYAIQSERPSAEEDMAKFVIALARHARVLKPDFAIVPQNAEELLLRPAYLAEIDGIAKEDLFYGNPTPGQLNYGGQVRNSLAWLAPAKRAGLPVLIVEYIDDPLAVREAKARIEERGFVSYFAPRTLDRLVLAPPLPPSAPAPLPAVTTTVPGAGTSPASEPPSTKSPVTRQ